MIPLLKYYIFWSCIINNAHNKPISNIQLLQQNPRPNESSISIENKSPNQNQVISLPEFFVTLTNINYNLIKRYHNQSFLDLCNKFQIDSCSNKSEKDYMTLTFLHQLFTCKMAENGSIGDILSIPYFWHWVNPNPRHSIIHNEDQRYLDQIKPPQEFSRYRTFADIDRMPSLYFSDLLSDKPKYCTEELGSFHSFGWCSEREMAFVSLATILSRKARVVTIGNHSYSEVLLNLNSTTGESKWVIAKLDHTFNIREWNLVTPQEAQNFNIGNDLYNRKAHSRTELNKLKALSVSPERFQSINQSVKAFYQKL